AAGDRYRPRGGTYSWRRRDDQHRRVVVLLAEIDGERRAGVEHRAGTGDLLAPVQVAERDVVRVRWEHAGRELVTEAGLHVALAAAAPAAQQGRVRHHHVHRVTGEALGEQRHHGGDLPGVVQAVLGEVVQQHLGGAHRVPV